MAKKQILIVGGGFGGVKAALELADEPRLNVTLISDRQNFRYYPALYHTATGGTRAQSSIPLEKIFAGTNVKLTTAEAKKLDESKHQLVTVDGQILEYDFLILALGVVTNYFGIKGLEKYSFGIKSLEEAEELKKHLHQQLTAEHQPDLNYIIIGGGPTGIELAGALPDYLRRLMRNHGLKHRAVHIDLVEAAPRLLPRMPEAVSQAVAHHLRGLGIKLYLDQKVGGETADVLMVNGQKVESHSVIWTAGVTNHPFFDRNKFELTEHGKVKVDAFLHAAPDVFVLGDNADTPFSGLAQTAIYDADFVTKNLKRHIAGHVPKTYKANKPIYVIPAGPKWAAVLWGKVQLYGWPGALLRQVADFVAFHDIEPLLPASEQWLEEFVEQENCPQCAKAIKY
jgi:NADH dehydrogenase